MQHSDGLKRKLTREKRMELTMNNVDRHQFEQKITGKKIEIRFDYDINVFSLKGDWRNHVRAVILYFPKDIVISNIENKVQLKRFEHLIQTAYEDTYFTETKKEK